MPRIVSASGNRRRGGGVGTTGGVDGVVRSSSSGTASSPEGAGSMGAMRRSGLVGGADCVCAPGRSESCERRGAR